jgi:hypothetical protein
MIQNKCRSRTKPHLHISRWRKSLQQNSKALKKLGVEGTFLNIIKAIYDKPKAKIILSKEKLKQFHLKSNQWNRIEDLEITPHNYSRLISNKSPNTYVGEMTVSSTNGFGKMGYPPYTLFLECKLVQPPWKSVGRFFKKLKFELPYNPDIPLLGIYSKECKSAYN